MKVIRSFPPVIPKDRMYVVDPIHEVFTISNFDYQSLFLHGAMNGIDFLLLEWDIAIQQSEIERLEKKVSKQPNRIHSVPYQVLSGKRLVWVNTDEDWQWVNYGTLYSAHFGFGCTYLPFEVYSKFRPNPVDTRVTDTNFSRWHYKEHGSVPIHWDIKVVHLNV